MGWPRRRRAQQQRLRRQISAAKSLLAPDSAPVEVLTKKQVALSPLKKLPPQHRESSTSKWFDAASPHKATAGVAAAGGHHRHRGLREKFYSVDSLAETEPEDDDNDDDDDDDETESEGSESGTPHHHQVTLKTEPAIPEEKEPPLPPTTTAHEVPKVLPRIDDELIETDDEEDGYSLSSSETKPPAPVPTLVVTSAVVSTTSETLHEETADQETSSESLHCSTVEFEVTGVVVDGEDTESEDESVADDVLTSSTVTVEEDFGSAFVVENSPVVELEEVPSTSSNSSSSGDIALFSPKMEENSESKQHQPFLFPPPYFPGDLDEYESDIYETLLRKEKTHHVTTDYFSFQPHVTLVMRSMLIDWLVEVHSHFNLQSDTLYLTVNYIDRFLAIVPVKRENFQLVALTALLIASKFEEVHPVDIEDLVYICERSYTAQQIVQFEKQMLAALQFNLVVPTCSGFLEYYVDKLSAQLMVAQLANFFSEQALLDFHLNVKYVPSVVASSALLLAQCYVERTKPELSWVLEFEEVTGYYAKDIWCCVRDLSDMLSSLSFDLVAVRTKFRSSRFGRVADLPHLNVSTIVIE